MFAHAFLPAARSALPYDFRLNFMMPVPARLSISPPDKICTEMPRSTLVLRLEPVLPARRFERLPYGCFQFGTLSWGIVHSDYDATGPGRFT